jgi:hypothetical protein
MLQSISSFARSPGKRGHGSEIAIGGPRIISDRGSVTTATFSVFSRISGEISPLARAPMQM